MKKLKFKSEVIEKARREVSEKYCRITVIAAPIETITEEDGKIFIKYK